MTCAESLVRRDLVHGCTWMFFDILSYLLVAVVYLLFLTRVSGSSGTYAGKPFFFLFSR